MKFHDCLKAIVAAGLLFAGLPVSAQQPDQLWGQQAEAGKGEKTRWFTDAKFGLFLHWGRTPILRATSVANVITASLNGS